MSPELKVMILNKTSDPRNGDHTQKLIHVSRSEPDPSLFPTASGFHGSRREDGFHDYVGFSSMAGDCTVAGVIAHVQYFVDLICHVR